MKHIVTAMKSKYYKTSIVVITVAVKEQGYDGYNS